MAKGSLVLIETRDYQDILNSSTYKGFVYFGA